MISSHDRGRRPVPDLDIGLIYTYEDHWMGPILRTLAASGNGTSSRLLLVDNASQKPLDRWLELFPRTQVIAGERRRGYAENLNLILQASQARYVLLLNTDMVFDPSEQCLDKLVAFMDAHPRCGLCSPRIYRYDGSYGFPARRFPTWQTAVGRRLGRDRWFQNDLTRYFYLDRDPQATMTCDWVTGCFMLVRREMLEAVGPLDEGFKKYFEDVDWCARTTAAGYDVMLCGDTYCFHAEQRASKKVFCVDGRKHLQSYARWLWKYRRGAPRANEAFRNSAIRAASPARLPINGDFDDRGAAAINDERRAA